MISAFNRLDEREVRPSRSLLDAGVVAVRDLLRHDQRE